MPIPLRDQLSDLASSFASAVLAAIRTASIRELVAESTAGATRSAAPARRSAPTPAAKAAFPARTSAPVAAPSARKPSGNRIRRSPAQIAAELAKVIAFLKTQKTPQRSEQIQAALKMDKRALPRVLKDGLAKKTLKSKGVKRSTTYSAA